MVGWIQLSKPERRYDAAAVQRRSIRRSGQRITRGHQHKRLPRSSCSSRSPTRVPIRSRSRVHFGCRRNVGQRPGGSVCSRDGRQNLFSGARLHLSLALSRLSPSIYTAVRSSSRYRPSAPRCKMIPRPFSLEVPGWTWGGRLNRSIRTGVVRSDPSVERFATARWWVLRGRLIRLLEGTGER